MEVTPECFDDDTPELTYQPDPDRHDVWIQDSGDGDSTTNRGLAPFLTFNVGNLRSIIFLNPTVHSANADLKFSARPTVIGTFGDVRIHYQRIQTWPDQTGPLPSLQMFHPTNRYCVVTISFNANLVESPAP
jgi:hypothetical protein